jgi:hypothetical protein
VEQLGEHLVGGEHNLVAVIAGLLVILCGHLLLKIFNFAITLAKSVREMDNKKVDHLSKSMEDNTKAVVELSTNLKLLQNRIVETDIFAVKQEASHKRLVATVKELAGDRWSEIQKKVKEDEFIGGDGK